MASVHVLRTNRTLATPQKRKAHLAEAAGWRILAVDVEKAAAQLGQMMGGLVLVNHGNNVAGQGWVAVVDKKVAVLGAAFLQIV